MENLASYEMTTWNPITHSSKYLCDKIITVSFNWYAPFFIWNVLLFCCMYNMYIITFNYRAVDVSSVAPYKNTLILWIKVYDERKENRFLNKRHCHRTTTTTAKRRREKEKEITLTGKNRTSKSNDHSNEWTETEREKERHVTLMNKCFY